MINITRPSWGYELSFGASLAKVGRNGCKVFMHERYVNNSIYYFLVIFVYFIFVDNHGKQHKMQKSDPLQPDDC